jgi:RHS repeat-associated protein
LIPVISDSHCLNAGFPTFDLSRMITGTTRTDGLFGTFPRDLGYHGMRFNRVIDVGNINNQGFELDSALSLIRYGAIDQTTNTPDRPDSNELLQHGTQDVLVINESSDQIRQFTLYFREGTWLIPQDNTHSPIDVVDAAIRDINGDNVPDLIVADESGVLLYLNDSEGQMVYTSGFYTATPRAIGVIDLNTNGLFDILVATAQGVRVYIAEDHLDYVTGQWLDTGDTTAMVLHDFNGNGLSDLITINRFGTIQFFKNMAGTGLVEVGSPVQAHGAGPLKVLDVLHNHQRDLIVEVAPGIEQVIDVGDIFGPQPIITSGKRVIRYAFFDHLGSTRMLTDDLGDVVWPSPGGEPNKLAPFGKDVAYSEGDIVRESYLLNFTNKEIDYNLDLHYFGARYYTADFPRFISPDPVSGKLETPITWNRYLYCRNDPVNYFDPDGRTWFWVQSTGELAHRNDDTGVVRRNVATGYSGHGDGVNNPAMENVENVGPIPSGSWTIGDSYHHVRLGPITMNLTPNEGTDTHGRTFFRMHGADAEGHQDDSTGCPVVGPNGRRQVSESNDNQLIVVSDENALNTAVQQQQNPPVPDPPQPAVVGPQPLIEADPAPPGR